MSATLNIAETVKALTKELRSPEMWMVLAFVAIASGLLLAFGGAAEYHALTWAVFIFTAGLTVTLPADATLRARARVRALCELSAQEKAILEAFRSLGFQVADLSAFPDEVFFELATKRIIEWKGSGATYRVADWAWPAVRAGRF